MSNVVKTAIVLNLTLAKTVYSHQPRYFSFFWFSFFAQVFHVRMLATDLRRSSQRSGIWSQYLLSWLLLAVAWLLIFFKGTRNIGWHTMYGDGDEVTPAEQDHLQETIWRNLVFDQWEQGDILVIDNFGVSHGRQVSYRSFSTIRTKEIEILVCRAELWCCV